MPESTSIGRWMAVFGLILAGIGGLIWLAAKLGLPLGQLPGDLRLQSKGVTCFLPLASSILISILLTLILNLIARWLSR